MLAARELDRKAPGRQPETADRARAIKHLVLIGAIFGAVSLVSYVVVYTQTEAWQILVNMAGLVIGLLCLLPVRSRARRRHTERAGYWLLAALVIVHGVGELVWSDATLILAVSMALLTLLVASVVRPRRWEIWVSVAALYAIYAFSVNWLEPFPRYPIMAAFPATQLVSIPLALAVLWQAIRLIRIRTIRTRLLIAFTLLVLLPTAAVSTVSVVRGFQERQEQVRQQIDLVATVRERRVRDWAQTLQSELAAVISPNELNSVQQLVGTDVETQLRSSAYLDLQNHLSTLTEVHPWFEELSLIDSQGEVLVSSNSETEGTDVSNEAYFQQGLEGYYQLSPSYDMWRDETIMAIAQPVETVGGEQVVLVGHPNPSTLHEILEEATGLGETGEAYIVDRYYLMLTPSRAGEQGLEVRTRATNRALGEQRNGSGLYGNYRGESVIGVYRWLPELEAALVVEQEQTEALGAVYELLQIDVGVALISILLAVVASLLVARGIAAPLSDLTETATQIADGDLERTVEVEREDEIGRLAQAFNSMTAQLRVSISSLEQRVANRTRELEQRSEYLQASAETARTVSSILDAEELAEQVVEQIRQRFDLYYVGLFMLDERGEWAMLRAGTGEAGQAMLERGHQIKVGEGMIGWSIAHDQARIALDVGEDAVRLTTPELPHTRSEAALPLRSRGEVIGALTVQSDRPAAFNEDTVAVLQTMADQVAVALDNARLFASREEALEISRRAYGEISREAWVELLREEQGIGYRSDISGVASARGEWPPEMAQAWQQGRTVASDGASARGRRPLAVPIKVRGNVVGVLGTYKPEGAAEWTPEEIALLETMADQVGTALESARLYQEAQRRAVRERIASEITTRMRETLSVDTVLETTVREIGESLGLHDVTIELTLDDGDEVIR